MKNRLFSLPYTPGIIDVIEELPTKRINDIYFSDNAFGSARALSLKPENYSELYELREKYGIKLQYLINGNYYSNEFYEELDKVLDHIKQVDPDIVCMNNTYVMRDHLFMSALRNVRNDGKPLEVKNSVNNIPRTLKDVMFLVEVLSIRSIIVDRSLNRNLDELKKIREYCNSLNIPITMLINEGCIVDCLWKNIDDMMIAQTNEKSNMKVINIVHQKLGCTDYFEEKPQQYLKTAFTLPNNLQKFDDLVDIYKLAGRGVPIEKWLKLTKAYMYEDSSAQLKDLFSTKPPNILMNTSADELTDVGFNKVTENCKNVCGTECTLCDDVLIKLFPRLKR
jgi:collagenase-like PrtC family protease